MAAVTLTESASAQGTERGAPLVPKVNLAPGLDVSQVRMACHGQWLFHGQGRIPQQMCTRAIACWDQPHLIRHARHAAGHQRHLAVERRSSVSLVILSPSCWLLVEYTAAVIAVIEAGSLGRWLACVSWRRGDKKSDRTQGQQAVDDFQQFVDVGITTFDTADHYGPSEVLISKYLQNHSAVRNQVQIATKYCAFGSAQYRAGRDGSVEEVRMPLRMLIGLLFCCTDQQCPRHAAHAASCFTDTSVMRLLQAVNERRQRLGVDALDLLQFYWADYDIKRYVAAGRQLADLQAAGKINHIGLTNFDVPRVQQLLDAGVPVVSHQVIACSNCICHLSHWRAVIMAP